MAVMVFNSLEFEYLHHCADGYTKHEKLWLCSIVGPSGRKTRGVDFLTQDARVRGLPSVGVHGDYEMDTQGVKLRFNWAGAAARMLQLYTFAGSLEQGWFTRTCWNGDRIKMCVQRVWTVKLEFNTCSHWSVARCGRGDDEIEWV